MKSIKGYWSKCDKAGWIVKVMIKNKSAIKACNRNMETGWSVRGATSDFNRLLSDFGFRITRVERWVGDEFD